jgi:hypothetical protein
LDQLHRHRRASRRSVVFRAPALSARDRRDLRRRGLGPSEAARQAALLHRPPAAVRLDRPCVVGDGVERWSTADRRLWAARAAGRRFVFFTPASGASSRLFAPLDALFRESRRTGTPPHRLAKGDAARFFRALPGLAIARPLAVRLRRRGFSLRRLLRAREWGPVLEELLSPGGLAAEPKGLLPFHCHGTGFRTAFEEHVRDAAATGERGARVHFTVSPRHREAFRRAARRAGRPPVSFSLQNPATDTLSLAASGGWARHSDGSLLFRPGGHGALLENLNALRADAVFIRNIDNVGRGAHRGRARLWRRALAGRLVSLVEAARTLDRGLARGEPTAVTAAARFLESTLGRRPPRGVARRSWLRAELARPWRVCGVVPNRGEPGGGPFWVKGAGGLSRQIVEAAQVGDVPAQRAIFRRARYFNPVDMAVAFRGPDGRPLALRRFVDETAVLVSSKRHEGHPIRVLERPGLWNGAMAGWNTVFVEMPVGLFHPVKTITDLLRPGHRTPSK